MSQRITGLWQHPKPGVQFAALFLSPSKYVEGPDKGRKLIKNPVFRFYQASFFFLIGGCEEVVRCDKRGIFYFILFFSGCLPSKAARVPDYTPKI